MKGIEQCLYVLKTQSPNGSELKNNAAKMIFFFNITLNSDQFSDIFSANSHWQLYQSN